MESLKSEQLRLEDEALYLRQLKFDRDLQGAITQGRFADTIYGNVIYSTYFDVIAEKIQKYLDSSFKGHNAKVQKFIKYLSDDADKLAYIVLGTCINLIAKRGNTVKLTALAGSIIRQLAIVKTFSLATETDPKLIVYLGEEYKRASRKRKAMLIKENLGKFKALVDSEIKAEAIKAGTILVDLVSKSGCDLLVVSKERIPYSRKRATIVSFNPEVFKALEGARYLSPTVALYPPLVVPPKDWTSFYEGGYYTVKYPFIKVRRKEAKILEREDLSLPMRAVNNLQRTAWRVNRPLYDIINHIYSHNLIDPKSPREMPRLYGGIPLANAIEWYDIIEPKEYSPSIDKREWAIYKRKRDRIRVALDGEKGRRLQYLMSMGVARKMMKYEEFYYAYQLDYRGRVYPITDFFNPQSKGYVKSMLEFSKGEYLTERGLYWLKIHTANCYGLDKEPFEDRIKWFEENRLKIVVAASDPLGKLGYWSEADSPYEFIASCLAYKDHIDGKLVHLPIQLDAVNSGVQIYSGILRDYVGAKATCVVGSTREDLYQRVADKVNEYLEAGEYEKYISFIDKERVSRLKSTEVEARSLKGKITRSHVKKNVMTTPYSVTSQGMRQQNSDMMEDYKLNGKVFWEGDEWVVNTLITKLTSRAIDEVVKGARLGQKYLKDVTRLQDTPTMWHSPLYKVPVYQGMFKIIERRVKTVLGTLVLKEATDEVKVQKQLASVAANFIHSIDAAILMYVVDHMRGYIGVIHDCFLTSPNDGDVVRDLYKEGYVTIMKLDPLKLFSDELDKDKVVEIPYIDTLNLDDVLKSEYIIS